MSARRSNSEMDKDVRGLESVLAGALHRVRPPGGMVHRLRQRLQFPGRAAIAARLRDWRRLAVVFGGVMSGLVVVLTVARAFFHLVIRRNSL